MVRMLRERNAPMVMAGFLTLLGGTGCTSGDPSPVAILSHLDGGPHFFVQSEPATAVMEAFFDGRVVVDEAGCLRLDIPDPEGATVIWPHGFTLDTYSSGYRVLDAEGDPVSVLGERFRFGGGFVSTLHEGIPLDGAARDLATERCPGAYWIVGDLP